MPASNTAQRQPTPAGVVDTWRELASRCPFRRNSHRWYTYHLVCRHAIGWAKAVDKFRECTSKDTRDLYRPTADHYANRLSGALEIIDKMLVAHDADPYAKSRGKNRKRAAGKDANGNNKPQ